MQCPECGTPIEDTLLRGNLLRFADYHWLGKVRTGVAIRILFVFVFAFYVVAAYKVPVRGSARSAGSVVALVLGSAGGILSLAAACLITTSEPRVVVQKTRLALRHVVRGSALVGMLAASFVHVGSPGGSAWNVGAGLLTVVAGFVNVNAELVYLRRFARRIPSEKLELDTTTVLWFLAILCVLVALGALVLIAPLIIPASSTAESVFLGAGIALPFAICGGFLAGCTFALWYVIILFRYYSAIRLEASEARRRAAESTQP
jgi:hypothetical protein